MLLRINAFYAASSNLRPYHDNQNHHCRRSIVASSAVSTSSTSSASSASSSSSSLHRRNSQHHISRCASFYSASRTQRKLWLQRQSFLADDKNYLDHPANMKLLTQEINRVNREYQHLLLYQDPLLDSIKRVIMSQQPSHPTEITSSNLTSSVRIHHKSLISRLPRH